MVEVLFKAESIQDLKLMIQEYSLAHLGLTPEQLFNLRKPIDLPSGAGKPGVTEEVRLNDGTVRLHNRSYPSKMPNMPEEKRKPGRPKGWRKEKTEAAPDTTPTPSPMSPQPTKEPTLKDLATKAVNALAIAKGVRVASDAMEKMGAPRLPTTQMAHLKDVPPEKYQELIELCERTALEN